MISRKCYVKKGTKITAPEQYVRLQRLPEDDTIFPSRISIYLRMYTKTVPVGAGAVFFMLAIHLNLLLLLNLFRKYQIKEKEELWRYLSP